MVNVSLEYNDPPSDMFIFSKLSIYEFLYLECSCDVM